MSKEETIGVGIGQRLREVRGGRSQAEFAEILGVHVNSIVRYESGKSTPDVALILKLFEKLQVDPAWLIAGHHQSMARLSANESRLLEIYRSIGGQRSGADTLGQRLREVRGEMPQTEFGGLMGVVQPTVARYESGSLIPDAAFLVKLVESFNVDPSWLLLGKETDISTESSIRSLVSVIVNLEKEKG